MFAMKVEEKNSSNVSKSITLSKMLQVIMCIDAPWTFYETRKCQTKKPALNHPNALNRATDALFKYNINRV